MKNQTRKTTLLTHIATAASLFYSLMIYLYLHISAWAVTKLLSNGMFAAVLGESGEAFNVIMLLLQQESFARFAVGGMWIALMLLFISQLWEIKQQPYSIRSAIGPVIAMIIAALMRYLNGGLALGGISSILIAYLILWGAIGYLYWIWHPLKKNGILGFVVSILILLVLLWGIGFLPLLWI